jgi:hypothetical protein
LLHRNLPMSLEKRPRLFRDAWARIRRGALTEAMELLDELILEEPCHADALACRAYIHVLHGNLEVARDDLTTALRRAPAGWRRRAEVKGLLGELEYVAAY